MTWYSKLLAVAVFLATFVVAFNLGILYQQVRINTALLVAPSTTIVTASSTTEVIPSTIRISTPSTTDMTASTTTTTASTTDTTASTTDVQIGGGAGAHCGGFIQNAPACAKGFRCQLGDIPNNGGTCVAD